MAVVDGNNILPLFSLLNSASFPNESNYGVSLKHFFGQ